MDLTYGIDRFGTKLFGTKLFGTKNLVPNYFLLYKLVFLSIYFQYC